MKKILLCLIPALLLAACSNKNQPVPSAPQSEGPESSEVEPSSEESSSEEIPTIKMHLTAEDAGSVYIMEDETYTNYVILYFYFYQYWVDSDVETYDWQVRIGIYNEFVGPLTFNVRDTYFVDNVDDQIFYTDFYEDPDPEVITPNTITVPGHNDDMAMLNTTCSSRGHNNDNLGLFHTIINEYEFFITEITF